jgi:hypothetical protein
VIQKFLLCLVLLFPFTSSFSQDLRDPTIPLPISSDSFSRPSSSSEPAVPVFEGNFSVVSRDGVVNVIYGGRTYAVGDLINGLRIEKIEESKMTLRMGKKLIHVPYLKGVVKSDSSESSLRTKECVADKSVKARRSLPASSSSNIHCFSEKK